MRMLFLFLSGLLLSFDVAAAADPPPNVVLIISDDQAWTDFGFMGHKQIRTPHIDRLAAESLTFSRGYVCDSLCRPSLATIVTGLYPHQHGIVGNDPPPPADLKEKSKREQRRDPRYLQQRIDYIKHIDDDPRLADILHKELGYLSHQSGKWWEGNFSRGGFTHGMTHGDRRRGGRHGDDGLQIGRKGLDPIFQFIETSTKQEKPFFVYYAPFLPHTPHNPPVRLLDKYRDKTPHLPIAKYWAMCEWFDETVGDLLGHLDEKGLAENTIVLFVTDNGWINQTGRSAYAPRSKRSQYEGGTRTPIMVRWPGHVKPKLDTTHLANSIDLVPTVLAATGLKPTKEMQGINLLDTSAVANRDAIFGEILEHDIQHMTDPVASLRFRWVIEGEWKLIVPHAGREPEAATELFHITADPHERKNLAAKQPQLVRRLTKRINGWWPAKSKP
ncbi:MAG: sulfatase [Planctomycetaceae bacterium]|jgi:arylsulfatase A-like enzyme|nr:sulfatase [Planctomycetaceae bacterium]MBT6487998.1 sulfatase [Planctomycetaceae bacterium]MBT6495269.1 sulfatase [Planctomycetaceae bacterium]